MLWLKPATMRRAPGIPWDRLAFCVAFLGGEDASIDPSKCVELLLRLGRNHRHHPVLGQHERPERKLGVAPEAIPQTPTRRHGALERGLLEMGEVELRTAQQKVREPQGPP